jgi:hypothetical protein
MKKKSGFLFHKKNLFSLVIIVSLALLLFLLPACQRDKELSFPDKPITMIVYMAPGGLIDITARKFVAGIPPFFLELNPQLHIFCIPPLILLSAFQFPRTEYVVYQRC